MTVSLVSFGYKYGLPTDADLALDCRFLPNPFFVEELRPKTGLDPDVAAYVLERPDAQEFLDARAGAARLHAAALSSARARATSPSPSAAPAAAIARWCWWRSCAPRSPALGHRVLVRHRDVER